MQRNKYLDALGLDIKNYGSNFIKERKIRRFFERRKYGFDYRQVVNMDIIFAEWLYSRLMMFKKQTPDDLTFHSIEFEGENYTIEQAIDKILSLTKNYMFYWDEHKDAYDLLYSWEYEKKILDEMKTATRLWAEIMCYIDLITISKRGWRKLEKESKKEQA